MTFAVKVDNKVLVDTVHEHAESCIILWLANCSGDYDIHDFNNAWSQQKSSATTQRRQPFKSLFRRWSTVMS